jgi:hypothetical protein
MPPPNCLLKNQNTADHSKMMRCKEVKKSRTRSHALMRDLGFSADKADRRFSMVC